MYNTVLFDLDGTLTDPGIGITNSVAYALDKFGIKVPDRTELYKFIGPPLQDSFTEFYGFSETDARTAVAYYRDYYNETGIYENRLYDGMADLLSSLCHAGKTLLVATSKPEAFSVRILEHFGIREYFTYIAGSNMDGTRSVKKEVIAYALEAGKVADRTAAVMIGDRKFDILGAKSMGLDSIGVLFGYGSRAELESAGADYIAAGVADIYPLIIKK